MGDGWPRGEVEWRDPESETREGGLETDSAREASETTGEGRECSMCRLPEYGEEMVRGWWWCPEWREYEGISWLSS